MTSEFFLLNKLNRDCYSSDPFPHIIIDECLNADIYDSLVVNFPDKHLFNVNLNQNNIRADIFTKSALDNDNIPSVWKSFLKMNNSDRFGKMILDFFSEDLIKIYPNLFKNRNDVLSQTVGSSHKDSFNDFNLLTEMSIAINTAVKSPSTVRNAHLDNSKKIFTSLFYMNNDNKNLNGGDLILYKWNNNYSTNKKKLLYKEIATNDYYIKSKVVKYSKNKLILFLNSIDSLHGVSPRAITDDIRQFCCITCGSEKQYSRFAPSSKFELLKLKIQDKLKLI